MNAKSLLFLLCLALLIALLANGCAPAPQQKPAPTWLKDIDAGKQGEDASLQKQLADANESAHTYRSLFTTLRDEVEKEKDEKKYTGAVIYTQENCLPCERLIGDIKATKNWTVSRDRNPHFWVVDNPSMTTPTVRYFRDGATIGNDIVGYSGTRQELTDILRRHPLAKTEKKAASANDSYATEVWYYEPIYIPPIQWQVGPFWGAAW